MTGYLYRGRPGLAELNARIMADRAAGLGGRGPNLPGHGTEAGARRHWRAGEKACPACATAATGAKARRVRRIDEQAKVA